MNYTQYKSKHAKRPMSGTKNFQWDQLSFSECFFQLDFMILRVEKIH